MIFETIVTAIFSGIVSGGAVGVIAKRWMDHSFNVSLARIEAKNRILVQEHQVRFTRYDEKVTAAIEGAYALVCEYSESVNAAIQKAYKDGAERAAHEDLAGVDGVADRFGNFMRLHSIYLPEDVAQKLVSVRYELRDVFMQAIIKMQPAGKGESDAKGMSALHRVYEMHGLKQKTEGIMADLQNLVREHLSKFTLSD